MLSLPLGCEPPYALGGAAVSGVGGVPPGRMQTKMESPAPGGQPGTPARPPAGALNSAAQGKMKAYWGKRVAGLGKGLGSS